MNAIMRITSCISAVFCVAILMACNGGGRGEIQNPMSESSQNSLIEELRVSTPGYEVLLLNERGEISPARDFQDDLPYALILNQNGVLLAAFRPKSMDVLSSLLMDY